MRRRTVAFAVLALAVAAGVALLLRSESSAPTAASSPRRDVSSPAQTRVRSRGEAGDDSETRRSASDVPSGHTAPEVQPDFGDDELLSISGRVAFPDFRPIPGARVEVSWGNGALTDADGRYSIDGLVSGPPDHVACSLVNGSRDVPAGATHVDFVATTPVVRIRLTDETGGVLPSANLWVRRLMDGREVRLPSAESAAGGQALIAANPCETMLVVPIAEGFAEVVTRVEVGAAVGLEDASIVLRRSPPTGRFALIGRLATGAPPAAVFVTLTNEARRVVPGWSRERIEPDLAGRIEAADIVPGRYDVAVDTELDVDVRKYEMTARASVDVVAGSTTEARLDFASGGRVRVAVRDGGGEFVAPEYLELFQGGERVSTARFLHQVDEDTWIPGLGRSPAVLARAVAPGDYVVAVTLGAGDVVRRDVTVRPGATADVDVTLGAAR